jgi:hypothetical protein
MFTPTAQEIDVVQASEPRAAESQAPSFGVEKTGQLGFF